MLFFGHPEVEFRYRHTHNGLFFCYLRRSGGGGAVAPAEISRLRDSLKAGLKRIGVS
jgi:hypothetical protein